MSNVCFSRIAFYTEEQYVSELINLRLIIKSCKKENGSFIRLKDVIVYFKTNDEYELGFINGVDDRQEIVAIGDILENDGDIYFRMDTEDAWFTKIYIWEWILKLKQFEHVKVCYTSEEEGEDVFINSDRTGRFFPEKYLVDYPEAPDGNDYYEYFNNVEDTIAFVNKITGKNFKTIVEIRQYQDDLIEEEKYFWVREYMTD